MRYILAYFALMLGLSGLSLLWAGNGYGFVLLLIAAALIYVLVRIEAGPRLPAAEPSNRLVRAPYWFRHAGREATGWRPSSGASTEAGRSPRPSSHVLVEPV
jgi:hypothetical protein